MPSWFEKAKGHMWKSPEGPSAWTAKVADSGRVRGWGSKGWGNIGKSPLPRPVPTSAAIFSKGASRMKLGRALTIGGAIGVAAAGAAFGGLAAMVSVNPYINRKRSNGVPMQSIGPGYPTFSGGHGPMSSNNLGTAGLTNALYNTRHKQH